MEIQEIETTVKNYCDAEEILEEKLPQHEKFHFGFKIIYPPKHPQPKHLVVVVPKDKKFVSIELATKISSEHLDSFKKLEEQTGTPFIPLFFHILRNLLLNRGLFYTFNLKNNSYIISEHIYFDGLTMDRFYQCIRKIYYAAISAQLTINEVASGKFKGVRLPKIDSDNEDHGSPEELYYS
jgi:hypothetical protein